MILRHPLAYAWRRLTDWTPPLQTARRPWRRPSVPYTSSSSVSVAVATVFIARENVRFMREWIDHHRALGVSEFHLYDNSAVEAVDDPTVAASPHFVPGQVNVHGVDYRDRAGLSDGEVDAGLAAIAAVPGVPGVYFYDHSPRDENGQVVYGQRPALNDAVNRLRERGVTWLLAIDMDEFLVLPDGANLSDLLALCRHLENWEASVAYLQQVRMADRWSKPERAVMDNNLVLHPFRQRGRWVNKKYLCRVDDVSRVGVHGVDCPRGTRHAWLPKSQGYLLHHNAPATNADMRWWKFRESRERKEIRG